LTPLCFDVDLERVADIVSIQLDEASARHQWRE